MGIYIKDPVAERDVRKLAKLRGTSLTSAIRTAVRKELELEKTAIPVVDEAAVDALLAEFAAWPKTGLKADKEFFDSLNDE